MLSWDMQWISSTWRSRFSSSASREDFLAVLHADRDAGQVAAWVQKLKGIVDSFKVVTIGQTLKAGYSERRYSWKVQWVTENSVGTIQSGG